MRDERRTEFQWRHAIRGVIAGTVGNTIEFYDFFVYGMVASLVFDKLFFPRQSPYVGMLLSLSTFAVGFIARPVGAAFFGHFGDRLGRKATLVSTLTLTGLSTVAIGLAPTYRHIGIWAAVVLVALRLLQGFGLGGEWGGSVLISIEWERFDRWRGFFASCPHIGTPGGMLLAAAVLSLCNHLMNPLSFQAWGWRVPFLLGGILIGIGLWVRLGIIETPDFTQLRERQAIAKRPVFEALRDNWREVVLTALARSAEQGPFYIFMTFVLAYGTRNLGLSQKLLLQSLTLASAISLVMMPFFGFISDLIGRKTMYLIGAGALTLYAIPYYLLLGTGIPRVIMLAVVLSIMTHDMMYGPQPALIAEVFPLRVRYSGASMGYQLSSVLSGGPAPLIASYLMHTYGSPFAISVYMMGLGVVSIVATIMLPAPAPARLSENVEPLATLT
jgi:MFS family permease